MAKRRGELDPDDPSFVYRMPTGEEVKALRKAVKELNVDRSQEGPTEEDEVLVTKPDKKYDQKNI